MAGSNGQQRIVWKPRCLSAAAFVVLLALSCHVITAAGDLTLYSFTHGRDPNPCESFPCGPVGTCRPDWSSEDRNAYTCKCDRGFHQENDKGPCVDVDECQGDENPCAPGTCRNTLGDYFCDCPVGYVESIQHGDRKCIKDTHACKAQPCGPAGSCVPMTDGSYTCDCEPGFAPAEGTAGPCLEIDDPCTGNPCGPGGQCSDVLGGGYHCTCFPGYSLPPMFKRFGGKCQKIGN